MYSAGSEDGIRAQEIYLGIPVGGRNPESVPGGLERKTDEPKIDFRIVVDWDKGEVRYVYPGDPDFPENPV